MYGHGFGTMFLASVYGEEEDKDQREKLEKVLKKAVEFICKAQTTKKHRKPEGKEVDIGGWGYVSAADGGNFDEGSVTITAAPGAAGRAERRHPGAEGEHRQGDRLPRSLHHARRRRDLQLRRRQRGGPERPGAARRSPPRPSACAFSAGQYKGELRQEVDQVLQGQHPDRQGPRQATTSTRPITSSQFVYILGDDRYGEMFPKEAKEHLADLEQVQGGDVPVHPRQPGQDHRRLDAAATSARSSPPP